MKAKKMLSVLLAAVMMFGLLCTPALAATRTEALDSLRAGDIWVDIANPSQVRKEMSLRLLRWILAYDDSTNTYSCTKDTAPTDIRVNVLELPLGVTLAAGPNCPVLGGIFAYSDPDGDGVYEQRLEKYSWTDSTAEILPLTEQGLLQELQDTDEVEYNCYFDWGYGANSIQSLINDETTGYRTVTTDHLVDLFGANTLIRFYDWDNSNDVLFILLTGEERPAGLASNSLADAGIYITEYSGDIVSQWAMDYVDYAAGFGLLPYSVEKNHGFDLTENITRGEFATIAMYLYCEMAGTDDISLPTANPFVDVDESDPNYEYILAAYSLGIVNGTSTVNKTFSPNNPLSRQDAATMLARVYTVLGGQIPSTASTSFADDGQISAYAKDAVSFMSANGIINGVGNNRFSPKNYTTVEQSLKIALEMLFDLDV